VGERSPASRKGARRSNAANAAGHAIVILAWKRPLEAAGVIDLVAVVLQLWGGETGRPARKRRPASLAMRAHGCSRARATF
jgi:hypothetical protein